MHTSDYLYAFILQFVCIQNRIYMHTILRLIAFKKYRLKETNIHPVAAPL